MKRALVFLVLGPVLAATTVISFLALMSGKPPSDFEGVFAVVPFLFTLPVAALAAALDAYLARSLAMPLRALLISAAGALFASGFASGLCWMLFDCPSLPFDFLPYIAGVSAACMGACSLLASDHGWRHAPASAIGLRRN